MNFALHISIGAPDWAWWVYAILFGAHIAMRTLGLFLERTFRELDLRKAALEREIWEPHR